MQLLSIMLASSLREARQERVADWTRATFGAESAKNPAIRACRFLEEAMTLAQACGLTADQAVRVLSAVYNSPQQREPGLELGGVGVTLLALGASLDVSVELREACELQKVLAVHPDYFRRQDDKKRVLMEGAAP